MNKLLEGRGISKSFGGLVAVDGFEFSVERKEILGLIGPNGAGKTTVFNIVMGEISQASGSIFFEGKDISVHPTYERVKMGIARTYQISKPFREMTIAENIRLPMIPDSVKAAWWGKKNYYDRVERVAEEIGLTEHLLRYPDELPLGALRRLELARAIAKNPKIILIDEVFAGLAQEEIDHIIKLISKKREEGVTFVIIDHNLRALSTIVDRVVVMNFGRKIAEGPYEKIIEDAEVAKAYLGEMR